MGNPMKIRAANKDGVTEVKVLVSHEMETGQRKGNAVVVIVAFFDVIGREALAFTGGLQGAGQFVKTDPLTQQGG